MDKPYIKASVLLHSFTVFKAKTELFSTWGLGKFSEDEDEAMVLFLWGWIIFLGCNM